MAVHNFQPTEYYTAIGAHEPVLHIDSGDTVITTTVDNGGQDKSDQSVTAGGNPQTSPFYIEGAEPRDTLSVHFDQLKPNRRIGQQQQWLHQMFWILSLSPHKCQRVEKPNGRLTPKNGLQH